MPAAWQQKLQHALRRVTLVLQGDSLKVGVDENRSLNTLEVFSIAQDASLQNQQVEDLLLNNELQEAPRFLLLELESVLSRELKLPLAWSPTWRRSCHLRWTARRLSRPRMSILTGRSWNVAATAGKSRWNCSSFHALKLMGW